MDNLNYGIIGNCTTGALVSESGAIEWMCLPDFHSPSIFAKILDQEKGGSFEILVDDSYSITQSYIYKTNILKTTFQSQEGSFELIDFMPRYHDYENDNEYYSPPDLIRYLRHTGGRPKFRVKYDPRLEYAQHPTKTQVHKEYIKSRTIRGAYDSLYLYTDFDKRQIVKGATIELCNDGFFLLSYNEKILNQYTEKAYIVYERTKVYWLNWSEKLPQFANYNEIILRSALVLKLLSYDKTGAVLAALTTSLPESLGEERNWDYRFCWLRDASMVIKVMSELGHKKVAYRYIRFLTDLIPDKDEKIQIMYGIDGSRVLTEKILYHLSGYENSKPVRIGNAAYKQKQNDIFGLVMDVLWQQFEFYDISLQISESLWTITRTVVRNVEKNWRKPDRGIWELRTEKKHFTFSKLLCWVAVDRGIKISERLRRDQYLEKWKNLREIIKEDILTKAWNEEVGAFTQFYGSNDMDAANLLMEHYGLIDAKDERYVKTVKMTQKELGHNGLMYRYKNRDDFGLPKSSFTICTFWLTSALYKIGEKEEAIDMFETVLSYSNHLGIFSEDIDFESKRLLGNFPQAYSHLGLIETAILLSQGALAKEEEIVQAIHHNWRL